MLFSFEGGGAKGSIIARRVWRPRRNIELDEVSRVLGESAGDNLTAERGCFVFDSLFDGEPVQLFKKRFSLFCSTSLATEFCTCWSGLISIFE